jgi:hypothetical protein
MFLYRKRAVDLTKKVKKIAPYWNQKVRGVSLDMGGCYKYKEYKDDAQTDAEKCILSCRCGGSRLRT